MSYDSEAVGLPKAALASVHGEGSAYRRSGEVGQIRGERRQRGRLRGVDTDVPFDQVPRLAETGDVRVDAERADGVTVRVADPDRGADQLASRRGRRGTPELVFNLGVYHTGEELGVRHGRADLTAREIAADRDYGVLRIPEVVDDDFALRP